MTFCDGRCTTLLSISKPHASPLRFIALLFRIKSRDLQSVSVCRRVLTNETIHVQGKQGSVWLVTSVLSHQRLSDAAITENYCQRWNLEVFFRDFKRTFGKHKQLSRTPEHVRVELHWSLMSLSVVLLDARLKQQQRNQQHRTSVSGLLRVIRRAFDNGFRTSVEFFQAIQQAVIDRYHRVSKSRRACPQRRTRKPPGQPNIQKPPLNLDTLAQSIKHLTLTSYG